MKGKIILPLTGDAASRYVPWFIAFMVWLAVLALGAVLILSAHTEQWRNDLTGNLTIQVPVHGEETNPETEEDLNYVLSLLRDIPEIASAEEIPRDRVIKLLIPWLGREITSGPFLLPIPRIISVKIKPKVNLDVERLWERLNKKISGVQVDDHQVWLAKLFALTDLIEGIAFIILLLVSIACVATVIFATRTSLNIHSHLIDLLHIIGARDEFVAHQFCRYAMSLGFKGGLLGICMGIATFFVIDLLASEASSSFIIPLTLSLSQWACITAISLVTPAISAITSWVTVLKVLSRVM
ncbi:MAG: FtsX-like permease family protein [Pseudomonadota bacterium]|nr:FtsX-like permease family protein [Pseudomonadota bacterium]